MSGGVVPRSFERSVVIDAPPGPVWAFLTEPALMKRWMADPGMELEIETDWSPGSRIATRGRHHVRFSNIGTVLEFQPPTSLSYTHLSSLSRLPDAPSSYTTLAFVLAPGCGSTSVTLRASGFPTLAIFKHQEFYWRGSLPILKDAVERELSAT